MMNARLAALQVLCAVINEGRSLSDSLKKIPSQDPSFVQALCYGVCRWYDSLDFILGKLLSRRLKPKDHDIYCLLLMGIFQLREMGVPAHAVVSETVTVTQFVKKPWAKALVNGVLRNYLRKRGEIEQAVLKDKIAVYAHPQWLIEKIQAAWPENWQTILKANNQFPPFALRANMLKNTRESYLKVLAKPAIIIAETQAGFVLETPVNVQDLPGFAAGKVSVQDGGAQLAAELLELSPGLRVLDACAAPGGKSCHMLEIAPTVHLVAVDHDVDRVVKIEENLKRLQLQATCIAKDVTDTGSWWDGRLFDRILLDAPCSATGVIRRHPDIKLLRKPDDVNNLNDIQANLLKTVWMMLKPGGLLLYVTCSILPAENSDMVANFLQTTSSAAEVEMQASWGIACVVGRQILPGMHGMDGFYFAKLRKLEENNAH